MSPVVHDELDAVPEPQTVHGVHDTEHHATYTHTGYHVIFAFCVSSTKRCAVL